MWRFEFATQPMSSLRGYVASDRSCSAPGAPGVEKGMQTLFHYLIPAVLLAVLATLAAGLYALFRGGDFGRSYSNKLMRLRVLVQFIAVLVLVSFFWWRSHGG
jgi:hypothetical protein